MSNQSTDKMEDSLRRLKLHEKEDGSAQSSRYPGRHGERDCLHYLRTGLCGYGSNCHFNHPTYVAQNVMYYKDELPERVGEPNCEYFLKTGTCKYGSTCKYHHPKDRNGAEPVLFNILGFPMREGEQSCTYYMRTGSCKFGVACKFHHPQPVNGPSSSHGGTHSPPPVVPYYGGFTTASLPTATYGMGPHVQGPQAYVPVMISPSQGILPPQGFWNTYLGSASSTYPLVSDQIYDAKHQAESCSNAQIIATSNENLPKRPEKPECRYFMKRGTCRYGADCKYHHPEERVSQLLGAAVNPFALPSRPGRPVCSNFSVYGFCKFGPNCKFDHSFPGYTYGFSMPPVSAYGSSFSAYPRTSAANHYSETSASKKTSEKNQNLEAKKSNEISEKSDSEIQISPEHQSD